MAVWTSIAEPRARSRPMTMTATSAASVSCSNGRRTSSLTTPASPSLHRRPVYAQLLRPRRATGALQLSPVPVAQDLCRARRFVLRLHLAERQPDCPRSSQSQAFGNSSPRQRSRGSLPATQHDRFPEPAVRPSSHPGSRLSRRPGTTPTRSAMSATLIRSSGTKKPTTPDWSST